MTKKYRVLSLFSGAGGLDVGLERTGRFKTIACLEVEDAFCETLKRNRDAGRLGDRDTEVICADICKTDPIEIMSRLGLRPGELDLLAGGPPCQSFSTAGRRGTVQDQRGTLLWQYIRFLKAFQPRFFLMENVRGLLSAGLRHRPIKDRPEKGGPPLEPDEQPGSAVELWLAEMMRETHGAYRVDCFEVNAVNYGAPQLRERVLFIGNSLGRVVDFPIPTHGEEPDLTPYATLGMALDSVGVDDGMILDFSPRKKRYLSMVPEGGNWRALSVVVQEQSMGRAWFAKGGRSGWWRRLTRDLPCPTVVTMPNHAGTSMCHPVETRALTLRECAAVQEFPPDWEFCGTVQQKYTQVGNAIPTRLGEVAGGVIAAHLDSPRCTSAADETGEVGNRRVYIRSHVRTRQWYRDGETFLWSNSGDNKAARYSAKGRHRPAAKAV